MNCGTRGDAQGTDGLTVGGRSSRTGGGGVTLGGAPGSAAAAPAMASMAAAAHDAAAARRVPVQPAASFTPACVPRPLASASAGAKLTQQSLGFGAAMLRLLVFSLAVTFATVSSAQRQSALNLTCAEATALVDRAGSIVLGTGEYTYRRFVAHRGFCQHFEQTEPAWAVTAGGQRCRVGYRCVNRRRFRND